MVPKLGDKYGEVFMNAELIKELWTLWESLAECGEIHIGPGWIKKYNELQVRVSDVITKNDDENIP